jgi:hypothetical protein
MSDNFGEDLEFYLKRMTNAQGRGSYEQAVKAYVRVCSHLSDDQVQSIAGTYNRMFDHISQMKEEKFGKHPKGTYV